MPLLDRAAPSTRSRTARRLLLATIALSFGASGARAEAACDGAQSRSGEQAGPAIICLINEARERRGLTRLRADGRLERAAAGHATDMVRRRYFSHITPGGTTMLERIRRTGYLRDARSWAVGETLAWGRGERAGAAQVVEAWFDSPPHRRILLGAQYREIGLGSHPGVPFDSARTGTTYAAELGTRR